MTENGGETTRVFIADDHAIMRSGLAQLIDSNDDMETVGTAEDSAGVLRASHQQEWDVLVLDLSLPGAGGLEVLQQLKASKPKLPIVVFSMHPENRYALRVLRAGAAAYINKGESPLELVAAIRKAAAGGRYITHSVGELLLDSSGNQGPPHESMTEREYQVFMAILGGKQPSEIAGILGLSNSTVSTHIRHIRDKLGVESLADIIRYGLQNDLIES